MGSEDPTERRWYWSGKVHCSAGTWDEAKQWICGVDIGVQAASLDMAEGVLPTSVNSPAAFNRYIYYPDHLVRMPGPLPGVNTFIGMIRTFMKLYQEPVFQGTFTFLLKDLEENVRPSSLRDESVGDFVTRRFGQPIADNLVSALLHGIYAGDVYKLSVKTVFPLLWHLEKISESGVAAKVAEQMWKSEVLLPHDDVEFMLQSDKLVDISMEARTAIAAKLEGSSVYTFKQGLGQLAQVTERALRDNKNVEIKNMTAALTYDWRTRKFLISDADCKEKTHREISDQYDYVVATISPSHLSQALRNPETRKTKSSASPFSDMLTRLQTSTSTVNVMVVNLFYHNPNLIPVTGFGYLLPRSIPVEENPERALGVIFGSETSRGSFDPPSGYNEVIVGQDSVPGTKLTVMIGGHWWNSWAPSDLPNEESAIDMAKAVLRRHLGITEAPAVAKARMQWNAIPQYEVGHHERMAEIHDDLIREFDGRLKVAGSAYQGVGVNDCIKAARKASFDIREEFDERTGLEGFGKEASWAVWKKREGTMVLNSSQ